jgi:DNA-binding HxlR family transcriptional regulator
VKRIEFEQKNLFGVCPFMTAQQILSRKWTVPILKELSTGVKRFGELRKKFEITQTTLTQRLKLLEHEGLIHREVFPEVPPRVEYSLTKIGKDFLPVIDAIENFGKKYIQYLKNRDKNFLENNLEEENDFTD